MSRFKGGVPAHPRTAVLPAPIAAERVSAVATPVPAVVKPSVTPMQQAASVAAAEPLRRVAFFCALIFVFVRFSFLHEILSIQLNIHSYLPTIFGALTALGLIVSGGIQRTLRGRGGLLWAAFAIWLLLATAMSTWRGGSYAVINGYFRYNYLMVFAIGGLAVTWREFMALVYALGLAAFTNELTMRFMGNITGNRLEGGVVSIGNANDFGAHMLLLIPFLWLIATGGGLVRLVRWIALGVMIYGLYLTGSTGSRGALVALAAMAAIVIWFSTGFQKVMAVGASLVVIVLSLALLPGAVLSRYRTLVGNDQEPELSEAEKSSSERLRILQDSVSMTVRNPIFGVGPGEFGDKNGFEAIAEGRPKDFSVTHNTYTQISSENGIPALIFFAGAVFAIFRNVISVRRKAQMAGDPVVSRAAFAFLISITGFSVAAFFLSMAYHMYFPALAGLSIAFVTAANSTPRMAAASKSRV